MKDLDSIKKKRRLAGELVYSSVVIILLLALIEYLVLWYQGRLDFLSGAQVLSYYLAVIALILTTFFSAQVHFDNKETDFLISKIAGELSLVNRKLDVLVEEVRKHGDKNEKC